MADYKTISIPADFFDEIEKYIKDNPGMGYTSVTEFIKEAVREHLRQ